MSAVSSLSSIMLDPLECMPLEIGVEIFSHLSADDLFNCFALNKKWHQLAMTRSLWERLQPLIAIDAKKWKINFPIFGALLNQKVQPSYPRIFHKILKENCTIWKGKKRQETHIPVLMFEGLNLKVLGELLKSDKHPEGYHYSNPSVLQKCDELRIGKSYWALITTDLIPESRNKTCVEQEAIVSRHNREHKTNYSIASAIEVVACIFAQNFGSRQYLYGGNLFTFIRCLEQLDNGDRLVVDVFKQKICLNINDLKNSDIHQDLGVVGVWRCKQS